MAKEGNLHCRPSVLFHDILRFGIVEARGSVCTSPKMYYWGWLPNSHKGVRSDTEGG